ncbi:MAG: hypothetical protein IPN96_09645 [Anaerolineales bacterium]|nr:hypothetical protein [Anaerolineales bacterium]
MLQLSGNQTSFINRASRRSVSDIFQRKNDLRNGQWLRLPNSYLVDTTKKIQQDNKNSILNDEDLGAYVSISAPLHCIDGWTYLSRAVSSLIQGDFNTARHLGYYAELRGAISILATEGIAILGNDHFVIDSNERCWRIPASNGTHAIVWPVFEYWAKQTRAADLIGKIITPYGIELKDWHTVFSSGSTLPAIAEDWLVSWGLDLSQLDSDHTARNEISYRPLKISTFPPVMPLEISAFVKEFWSLFSPSGTSRFNEVDRYLLNKSLQVAHNAFDGNRPYNERVKLAVSTLFGSDKDPAVIQSFEQFLSVDQDTFVLREASSNAPTDHPRHVYQLLSRASLLLRLATGASADLILSAGISNSDFDFWWRRLGLDAGFWDSGNDPASPDELWLDIETSIMEVNSWMAQAVNPSIYKMHVDNLNAKHFWTLSGTERIAMWGMFR